MSFSSEVKDELARVIPRRSCCKKSELMGLFKACGSLRLSDGGPGLSLEAESAPVARKAFLYMKQIYHVQAQILVRRRQRLRHTNVYMVRVSGELVPGIMQELGLFGDPEHEAFARSRFRKCCARSFMRGFFLGAGFVGAPGKGHHLEMAVKDRFTAEMIVKLLERHEINAKVGARKTGPLIYIKHGTDIADFLSMIGANAALLAYENVRAYKTMRSRVNRLVNMETANLSKTAAAAYRQVEDIKYIEQRVGFGSLPDPLVEIARLRLDYPEATLEELGRMASTPVGKSGVNHRLRRLTAMAAELREHGSDTVH